MNIAYLIDWDIQKSSGVLNKIADQIAIWESESHNVTLCIISYKTDERFLPRTVKQARVFERKDLAYLALSPIKTFLGRNAAIRRFLKYIRENDFDLVYYRQSSMWYPALMKVAKLFPMVMEVNTLDVMEKQRSGKNIINKSVYLYGQNRLNKQAKGIVAVTHEIAEWYQRYQKPTVVVSNGIRIDSANFFEPIRGAHRKPALIFIGTPNQKWHGSEKIYFLAKELPEFDFHIIGLKKQGAVPVLKNLIEYGYLNNKDLIEEIYRKADIGIGSLSLYINEMKEACPLKVREYIAHGLPVILGYIDSDIDGQPFTLNIGNYPDNVKEHVDQIRNFVKNNYQTRISPKIAEEQVGILVKEKKRLSFLGVIINA